jgi:hypothetical protein
MAKNSINNTDAKQLAEQLGGVADHADSRAVVSRFNSFHKRSPHLAARILEAVTLNEFVMELPDGRLKAVAAARKAAVAEPSLGRVAIGSPVEASKLLAEIFGKPDVVFDNRIDMRIQVARGEKRLPQVTSTLWGARKTTAGRFDLLAASLSVQRGVLCVLRHGGDFDGLQAAESHAQELPRIIERCPVGAWEREDVATPGFGYAVSSVAHKDAPGGVAVLERQRVVARASQCGVATGRRTADREPSQQVSFERQVGIRAVTLFALADGAFDLLGVSGIASGEYVPLQGDDQHRDVTDLIALADPEFLAPIATQVVAEQTVALSGVTT